MTRPKYEGGLGFRDVELFNLALLARQAWRMLKSSESLSARILKARYFPSTSILDAELGNNPSQIWRAIIEGKEVLKIGLIKRIGDGNTTEIWNQNWLPKEASMRPIACLMPHRPTLVAELIDPTSARWRQELINSTFLPLDANVILNIPLSTRQYDDFWAWSQEKKGEFTVKSCCRMLITTKLRRETWLEGRGGPADITREKRCWDILWRIQVPSKIKVFLWRLAQTSLPTADVRHHQHMVSSPSCAICGAEDSWLHSLLTCTMARCVWVLHDQELVEHMLATTEPDTRSWLFSMIVSVSAEELVKITVTLWAIWFARRRLIHEGEHQSPLATHSFVNKFIAELEVTKAKTSISHARPMQSTA